MIYFDNNSTTLLSPRAATVMAEMARSIPLNPSSIHSYGRKAKFILEEARQSILNSFSALKNYSLTFTGSGTESNNLVLKNFYSNQIFISAIEHLSVYEQRKYSDNISLVQVDHQGRLDLNHLELMLKNRKSDRCLVSVIYANNATGVLQDFDKIVPLVRQYGAFMHTDFTQAPGKLKFKLDDNDFDFVTVSSHKFFGPIGIGGLFHKKGIHLGPQMVGGGQEKGLRSSTENVIGAVGMATAAAEMNINLEQNIAYISSLRDAMEDRLRKFYPDIKIASQAANRICNTSMILMPGVESRLQLIQFDLRGFAVNSGSACSSGKTMLAHVLSAMNYSNEDASCAIRISLSKHNTLQEVNAFCDIWEDIFSQNTLIKAVM
jgi:cysteine desulfurase